MQLAAAGACNTLFLLDLMDFEDVWWKSRPISPFWCVCCVALYTCYMDICDMRVSFSWDMPFEMEYTRRVTLSPVRLAMDSLPSYQTNEIRCCMMAFGFISGKNDGS
jgi:hypothetical protein